MAIRLVGARATIFVAPPTADARLVGARATAFVEPAAADARVLGARATVFTVPEAKDAALKGARATVFIIPPDPSDLAAVAAVMEYTAPTEARVASLAAVMEYTAPTEARVAGLAAVMEYVEQGNGRMAGIAVVEEYVPCISDLAITVAPADGSVDIDRAERIVVVLEDTLSPVDLSSVAITYTQSPVPVTAVDGEETLFANGSFGPGFQATASRVVTEVSGSGTKVTIIAQPEFGHIPGGDITVDVRALKCGAPWAEVTDSATWSVVDLAGTANRREAIYNTTLRAERAGWTPLLTSESTYEYEVDETFTGARIQATLNEHLAAYVQQLLPREAYGLPILGVTRRVRLLAKLSEHARDAYDEQATVLFDGTLDAGISHPVFPDPLLPGEQTLRQFQDTEKTAGTSTYFTLFLLAPPSDETPDWQWVYSDLATFTSAFAYGRYGHGDFMFRHMPGRWQAIDEEQN